MVVELKECFPIGKVQYLFKGYLKVQGGYKFFPGWPFLSSSTKFRVWKNVLPEKKIAVSNFWVQNMQPVFKKTYNKKAQTILHLLLSTIPAV